MKRITMVWSIGFISVYSAGQTCDVPARRDITFNDSATLYAAAAGQANLLNGVEQSIGAVRTSNGATSEFGGNDLTYDEDNTRVYVVGTTQQLDTPTSQDTNVVLVAFNQQGALDAGFNPNGNYYEVNQAPNANQFKAGVVSLKVIDNVNSEEGIALALDSNNNVGIGGIAGAQGAANVRSPMFILFTPQGELAPAFGPGNLINLVDGSAGTNTITGSFVGRFGTVAAPLRDIVFDSNDRPFLVGPTTFDVVGAFPGSKAYHIRLTTGGLLDTTFNSIPNFVPIAEASDPAATNSYVSGVVIVAPLAAGGGEISAVEPYAVDVDQNNNYVVGGRIGLATPANFALIYKILESGQALDPSFNSGNNTFNLDGSSPIPGFPGNGNIATGAVAVAITDNTVVQDLKVLDDGSIVAVGFFAGAVTGLPSTGRANGFVLKLTASGAFFTGFNPSGAVLATDGIAALGVTTPGLLLFGFEGNAAIDIVPKSVCCDSDGKIVVISDVSIDSSQADAFLVLSLNPDGTEDAEFNPSGLRQAYNGTIGNVTYNASLEANQSPAFGFNTVNFVNRDQAAYKGCAIDEENSIFIGGPGTDELLLAFKLCGGEAPTGVTGITCPAEPGTFICALIDKYSGLCATIVN